MAPMLLGGAAPAAWVFCSCGREAGENAFAARPASTTPLKTENNAALLYI
jgi:hypothetical protein